MELNYSGTEQVKAPPAAVWSFVADPARVARCLPAVEDVQVTGPNTLVATVQVGMGLIRGKFRFDIQVQPDEAGSRVMVVAQGGGLGSSMDLSAGANVIDNGNGTTTLDWSGKVTMSGPIARMSSKMIEPQAEKLIARTFGNMSANIAAGRNQLA